MHGMAICCRMKVCPRRTMDLLVLPILSDLQAEHADALARGRRGHAVVVLLQNYAAFWKAAVVHGALSSLRHLRDDALGSTPMEQVVARRVLVRVSASLVVLTVLLGAYSLRLRLPKELMLARNSHAIAFLLPSILCVTIPMSVFLGVLLALTGPGRTAWPPLAPTPVLPTPPAAPHLAPIA